jgi:multidrug efflux system outer membrane protein
MNKKWLISSMFLSLLAGCSLAPHFKLPDLSAPQAFKEPIPDVTDVETSSAQWQPALPLEAESRGQWWKLFDDAALDALQQQAMNANQNLRAASARVEQSRALVRASASSIFPTISADANVVRAKSADASTSGFSSGPPSKLKPYTLYSAGLEASYEVDLFARVLDNERALKLDAEAQDAMYKSVLLALQADVAEHYFRLRALDGEIALLRDTIKMRTEADRIMQKRMEVGTVSAVDTSRTSAELAVAKAEVIALERMRAALENALAVLLGVSPSEYHFAEAPLGEVVPPLVPAGVPSALLLRRPDISAAQSSMAAANRRVGVARTAFFPRLILTATGGFQSSELSDVLQWSSRGWALGQLAGSALSMTIFDNGRNAARVDVANAAYDEAVANWRQQALVAFAEVESALANQRLLADQMQQQTITAAASNKVFTLNKRRYEEGDTNYFDVVSADRDALAANRAAIQTRAERMLAAVSLIRVLGGGWEDVSRETEKVSPTIN